MFPNKESTRIFLEFSEEFCYSLSFLKEVYTLLYYALIPSFQSLPFVPQLLYKMLSAPADISFLQTFQEDSVVMSWDGH